jgi:hypothetical protein
MPEASDRLIRDILYLLAIHDVAPDGDRLAAGIVDAVGEFLQILLAAGGENDFSSLFGSGFGSRQTDAAGSAGNYNDLLVERFEFDGHDRSCFVPFAEQ